MKIGQTVTLKEENRYDRKTVISTEEVGEVVAVNEFDDSYYAVVFNDLVDEEGVTPNLWITGDELDEA